MLSESLRVALGFALTSATMGRNEFLTLEHLLLGLLHDPDAAEVLEACGADLKALEESLEEFIGEFESLEKDTPFEPTQTLGFRRVIQRAIMHVQGSGKDEVKGSNLLVAMCAEPESHAVYLLEDFLESTTDPYYDGMVDYGDRQEHCWKGDHENPLYISRLRYNTMYVPKILERLMTTAPEGADLTSWRY